MLIKSIGLSLLALFWATAAEAAFSCTYYQAMFERLQQAPKAPMAARVAWFSQQFLGRPYALFSWGEGAEGRFDQAPLYCFDVVDCETFVTAVLALAHSHSQRDYERNLRIFRYKKGQVDFLTRHHFTVVEWNSALERAGVLKDITPSLGAFKVAEADIDKAAWYQHLPPTIIRLKEASLGPQRLAVLKAQGQQIPSQHSRVTYLPWTTLFTPTGAPNQAVWDKIPQGAVIEIVRPHWPDKAKYGTYFEISHLGFVFRHDHVLWFRHASSVAHRVLEQPLIAYLQEARQVPSIAGIHVMKLRGDQTY